MIVQYWMNCGHAKLVFFQICILSSSTSMGPHTNSRCLGELLGWARLIYERCPENKGLLQIYKNFGHARSLAIY